MKSKNENELRRVLKQFKIDVFLKIVPQVFSPWISRPMITEEVRRLRQKANTNSVVDALVNLLKESEITNEVIEDKIPVIQLLGVAFNSSRRTWTAYSLKGDPEQEQLDSGLESNIKHVFHQNDTYATVTVKCVESTHWIQVCPKRIVRKKLRLSPPVYIAYFLGEPYMFVSKEPGDNVLQGLAEGLGYHGYKSSNLVGPDLDSMLQHLNQKGIKRGSAEPLPLFDNFTVTTDGKDFSQHEQRRKYIADLMGPSPPKLSNYVVLAKDVPWKGKLNHPLMQGQTFDMKIEFKTNDTVEMLKDMAEYGVLKVPPPSYVTNLLSTGKNNIKLKVTQAVTETETQTDA